jgi:potassium voltage-gated channel Eag-related subfamily H protein 8
MNFIDEYGFVVANDSLPTYHSSLKHRQTNKGESKQQQRFEIEGETAPDVTFLHSEASLSISNWKHQNPIGLCHHDVIAYQIDLRDCINPLQPRRQKLRNKTSISWSKVNWSEFNTSANEAYDDYLYKNACPLSKTQQVHYYERALQYAFREASKILPRGNGHPDPICWCTDKLEELLERRNQAWATASSTRDEQDHWEYFRESAIDFSNELKLEKTKAWEDFASTLNYSTEPSKVMNILKSIQRDPECSPTNFTMKSPFNNKTVCSDKGKACLFRKHFTIVCNEAAPPKDTKAKSKARAQKQQIREYIRQQDDSSEIASPYSLDELTVAISYLKSRKACGEDQIHNEYLIHANEPLRHRILQLINLIWETGVFPRSFRNSLIVPIFKGEGRPPEDPNFYRPVALTSCLCKLTERVVINRLIFFIESKGLFHHTQSAYRVARSTLDPLMRIVGDINNGFNKKPFHRTLATQLDLTSAFNKVRHRDLLIIMKSIKIPSCFGKFYFGFLRDRRFRVRYNNAVSKSSKEKCRSPQGTVSSPWLLDIYMEAML